MADDALSSLNENVCAHVNVRRIDYFVARNAQEDNQHVAHKLIV
jgi:hypothetical protein